MAVDKLSASMGTTSLRTGALFGGGFSLAGKELQDCYAGEVSRSTGRRQGKGLYTYPNKAFTYEGEYSDGKKTGFGKFTIQGHSFFEGHFVSDEIEGEGRQVYDDGSLYEGHFHLGEKHGQGKFVDTRKRETYEGSFESNARHGEGKLALETTGTTYEGHFEKHKPCGRGKVVVPSSGFTYEGEFKEDLDEKLSEGLSQLRVSLSGYGSIKCPDGSYKEGQFSKNKLQGLGLHFDAETGITYKGKFEGGTPCDEAKRMSCVFIETDQVQEGTDAEEGAEGEKGELSQEGEGNAEEQESAEQVQGEEEKAPPSSSDDAPPQSPPEAEGPPVIENGVLRLDSSKRDGWGSYGIKLCIEIEEEAAEEDVESEEPAGAEESEDPGAKDASPAKEGSSAGSPGKEQQPKEGEDESSAEPQFCVFACESGRTVHFTCTPTAAEDPPAEIEDSAPDTTTQKVKSVEMELKTLEGVAVVEFGNGFDGLEAGEYSLKFSSAGLETCEQLSLIIA